MATQILKNINEASHVLKDEGAFFVMTEQVDFVREKLFAEGYEEVPHFESIKSLKQFSVETSEIGFYFWGFEDE
ncbi:hypothetical protein [Paenibacillus chitinolyticus]|uniref:hypothetical protein n=1 Tax=Paenibacillus chitinolyticus TaxID=79263 RepID=UPI001C47B44A|nr:hypothetical protein [Paenibacillus chitinolyticus]MBV6717234.1 hypothetical protein [Paenibacillus chitinolyticus]